MKYQKILSLIFYCLIYSHISLAEDDKLGDLFPDKIPVSPNASSLGIFGAIPVGYYTGIPFVSIPIYEIDLDGKKIPINLSYHASGIRVNQEASWVGLGWALNAGGIISKQVNGGDDFGQSSYPRFGFYNNVDLESQLNVLKKDKVTWAEMSKFYDYINDRDIEADVYSFNFNSYSGTMLTGQLNMDGNTPYQAKGIVRNSEKYLDITYNIGDDSWIITDGQGYVYYFNSKEKTRVYSKSLEATLVKDIWETYINNETPNRNELMAGSSCTPEEEGRTSSWLLDSIKSPLGSKVIFNYDYQWIFTPVALQEYEKRNVGVKKIGDYSETITFDTPHLITYSNAKIRQAVLRKVIFDEGEIDFYTSGRLDIEGTTESQATKLDKIVVKNMQGIMIKKVDFVYSYLGNTKSNYSCRLLLDNVKINDNETYYLEYNKGKLPPKHSLAIDYWGYYNNRNAIRYSLPPFYYAIPSTFYTNVDGKLGFMRGKSMMVNPQTIEYGTLISIQYPTKGKSVFMYEPNDFVTDIGEKEIKGVSYVDFYFDESDEEEWGWDDSPVYGETFIIDTDNTNAALIGLGRYTSYLTKDVTANIYVQLQKKEGNGFVNIQINNNYTNEYFFFDKGHPEYTKTILPLNKGTYRLVLHKDSNAKYFQASCELLCEFQNQLFLGAGLRIKKIENRLSNKTETTEFCYSYPNGQTSGKSTTALSFHRKTMENRIAYDLKGWVKVIAEGHFLEATSHLFTPISYAAQGCPIGYSYVVESHGYNMGKTVYCFHNEVDKKLSTKFAFDQIPSIPDYQNGLPLSTSIYNANNSLLDSICCNYALQTSKDINSYKMIFGSGLAIPSFLDYQQKMVVYKLKEKIHYIYNKGEKIQQKYLYSYDPDYFQMKEDRTYNSDGSSICIKYNYAFDGNSDINLKLKQKHIIEQPLEIVTFKDSNVSSAKKIEYREDFGMLLPYKLFTCYKHGAVLSDYENYYQQDIEITHFTSKGKEMEKKSNDDLLTVCLWGYKGKYLIAEIKNTSYEEVKKFLPNDLLNKLQTNVIPSSSDLEQINNLRNKIPSALITTFKYMPLLGIISRIEPNGITTYYEYDNWGRLSSIKDSKNSVLNTFQYKYR